MSKAKALHKQRVKKRHRQKRTLNRIQNALTFSRQYSGVRMQGLAGEHTLDTIIRDEAAVIDPEEWKEWMKMQSTITNIMMDPEDHGLGKRADQLIS